jgi:hypothetical protein
MKTGTVELPLHWASYLINGDASGLDEGEAEKIDAGLEKHGFGAVNFVSVAEDEGRFTWHYHLYDCGTTTAQGGTVIEYTYLYSEESDNA